VRQVRTAADGHATAAAARIVPDVIVISTDRSPDTQTATIRDLRSNPITRHTPIVARVVAPSQTIIDSLRSAGADRVVVAATENATLISTIIRLSDVPAACRALRELRRSLIAVRQRAVDQTADAGALRLRTAQLSAALEQFKVCLLAVEPGGRCVAANHATTVVTGVTREEIVGNCIWDVVLPGAGRDLRDSWFTVPIAGTLNGPCALRRRDGGTIAAEMYAAAAVLPDLHVVAIQTVSP